MMIAAANTRAYWAKVWELRHLVLLLVQLDLRHRYRRTILGMGWALMNPILMMCVLCAVFHQIFKIPIEEHAPFVLAGTGIWAFIAASIQEGCNSIYAGDKYIRSTPMPLAIYPLRTLMAISVQFFIVLALAFLVTLVLRGYERPLVLLTVIPSLAILLVFGWAMAVLFGFANVYFPDTQQVAGVFLQVLYYLTPVFYPPELLQNTFIHKFLVFNPFTSLVSLVRDPLVFGKPPTLESYLMAFSVTVVFALLAIRMLTKRERTIIFHL